MLTGGNQKVPINREDNTYDMTLPDERYRALQWAEQFLEDLVDPRKTPRIPREIRQRARSVLRHYPGAYYIEELSRARPDIIAREMEQLHRFVLSAEPDPEVTQPFPERGRDPSL